MWLVRTVRAVLFGSTKLALLIGLGTLSWISTYTGMLELIKANMGEIGLEFQVAIGFAVAMLMLMIIWLLDQLFSPHNGLIKSLYTMGYVFLTIISVGFGFGFYWKFLESRSEASRSAESAVTQVQTAFVAASTRLDQLTSTFDGLTVISRQKAVDEREKGNSCPNSRPGDGPRRQLRDDDARKFSFAGEFVSKRAGLMKADMKSLNGDLKKIATRDKSTIDPRTGTRNEFMKGLGRKLDHQVAKFNAFKTDPQLKQFRNDFNERSQRTVFPDTKGGTFACPDAELQAALRGVVRAIDQLPGLEKPKITAVEGSEAIIEAFRRLTTTLLGAVVLKLPPSPEELRAQQERAVQMAAKPGRFSNTKVEAGLGPRDYVPLSIALFVDICLLLVSIGRPVDGFARSQRKLDDAKRSDLGDRLDTIRRVHADPTKARIIEALDNVSFTLGGHYWVAIPLGQSEEAAVRLPKDELERAEAEASVLKTVFVGLEDTGLYRQGMVPSSVARKKLAKTGSCYQYWNTFRVYKFYKGKWPDFVVRVAMGGEKDIKRKPSDRAEPGLLGAPRQQAQIAGQAIDYNTSIENPAIGTPLEVQEKLRKGERQEPSVDMRPSYVQQPANDVSTEAAAARAAAHARHVAQQPQYAAQYASQSGGPNRSFQTQPVMHQHNPENPIHSALDAVHESFGPDGRPAAVIPIRRSRLAEGRIGIDESWEPKVISAEAAPTPTQAPETSHQTGYQAEHQVGHETGTPVTSASTGGRGSTALASLELEDEKQEEPKPGIAKKIASPIAERLRRFRGAGAEEQAIVYENDDTMSAVSARVSPEGDQIEVNVRMARRPTETSGGEGGMIEDEAVAQVEHRAQNAIDAPAERPAIEQGAEPVVRQLMSLSDRLEMNSDTVDYVEAAPVQQATPVQQVRAPIQQAVPVQQAAPVEQYAPVQPQQPFYDQAYVQAAAHQAEYVQDAAAYADEVDDASDGVFDTESIANWFGQKQKS